MKKRISFFVPLLVGLLGCGDSQPGPDQMQALASGYGLYETHCLNCHGQEGEGLANLIPPLKNSDWILQHPDSVPYIIRHGKQGPMLVNGKRYSLAMPANKILTNEELQMLCNYIRIRFGNAGK
ncbi:MAG: cytochrome c [Bacteroidetes bacterium]|nr:cytochrome c [Bacteroidota bacterium]MCK6609790.1 cytochrome c [Bacteroidia bacterium]